MRWLCLAAVLACSPCQAAFFTFAEWDELPEAMRTLYISGSYDTLVAMAPNNDHSTAIHYQGCLVKKNIRNAALSENIRAFAKANPEFQRVSVQHAMINYLIRLCGAPQ